MSKKYLPCVYFLITVILYMYGFRYGASAFFAEKFKTLPTLEVVGFSFLYLLQFISAVFFMSWLYKYKYHITRTLSIIFSLIIAVNFFISISCIIIYHSNFSVGIAANILSSDVNEAVNTETNFTLPFIFTSFFYIFLFSSVQAFSKYRVTVPKLVFSSFWIIFPFATEVGSMPKSTDKNILHHFFIYHAVDFQRGNNILKEFKTLKNLSPVKYNFRIKGEGVENLIIFIGESARRQNHSLYGYKRKTTPYQDREKKNMLLFTRANAPAGHIRAVLALILSSLDPENYEKDKSGINDNIVNIANQYGYTTYWMSTQNDLSGMEPIILAARYKIWKNYQYDASLVPEFEKILARKGKKLIFIHINGSHINACKRYPKNQAFFYGDPVFDCYDNSILYTDKTIGKVMEKLKNSNSALIYFSDHGETVIDNTIIHADSKDAASVPFYIWYSDLIPKSLVTKGEYNKSVQTSIVFPLALDLMGLDSSPYQKYKKNVFLKDDLNSVPYDQLEE
ncbi:MAG: phosphoethanolamine transferase [Bergeyella sp.]|nr:phosphoethanolamine transferase [Bergeyella sp.]